MSRLLGNCLAGWGLLFGLAAFDAPAAIAQGSPPTTPESQQAARDKLYSDLADEVRALERQGNLLKRVVRLVRPTVVHIEARKPDPEAARFGREKTVEEAGSGVIFQHRGGHYIITNRHVISDAPKADIKIVLDDGRRLRPLKSWEDDATDIAVLAVQGENLLSSRFGNSDQVEIGDFVLAVGSPFGLSHSVTFGIISAKGRRDLELGSGTLRLQDFFQTDAAINPGNSGGPLLNLRGEVIGINTAIASNSGGNEGIGFSIPIKMADTIARQLIDNGRVRRAFLGVQLDATFTAEEAERLGLDRPRGAHVTGITPKSPAADAKLAAGDVILAYDGVAIDDDSHLVNIVSLTSVGKEVAMLVLRNRRTFRVSVRVRDRSAYEGR